MPATLAPRRASLAIAYVAVCVLWGSTYLAIRVALEGFPPFMIGAVRFLAAGAVLLGLAKARGEALPDRRQWAAAALAGTLFFAASNGLVTLAERSVSSGLASVLVATMPLWATVSGRLFGERASRGELFGVGLGLLGVCILELGDDLRASPGGAVMLLLAPLAWALGSLASRRLPQPASSLARTGAQMTAGGAVLVVLSAGAGERVTAAPSGAAILAVAYLCVFGSLVGFTAFSYLLTHTRPAVAMSYAYVNPVIAVGLGVTFAGERLDLASVAGAVVILAAVALVARARAAPPSEPRAAPSVVQVARARSA